MRINTIVASVLILFSANTAFAQSKEFTAAMNGWLNGPEASNLQALSELATSGDTEAQLFLGQIDRDTPAGGYSDYLVNIGRENREALLRSDTTDYTKNWLLNLSDASLAKYGEAIFGYRVSRDVIGNAIAMQEIGEVAAAEFVLWDTLIGGRFDLVNTMPSENYGLAKAGFLGWVSNYMGSENKAITMNRLLDDSSPDMISGLLSVKRLARVLGLGNYFSDKANQFIIVMKGQGYDLPDDANLVDLNANIRAIATHDAPLNLAVRACEKCTQDAVDYDCVIQSLEILGGYKVLLSIRTPIESILPNKTFIESERALSIFQNMLKSRSGYYARPIRSACVAEIINQ